MEAAHMTIREEPMARIEDYARVSIAFEVHTVLDARLVGGGVGGIELRERSVRPPFIKDYDAIRGNHPTDWSKRFDLSNWGLLTAVTGEEPVAGVVIAFDTPGLHMLEERSDLVVLWDLRVSPPARRCGLGSALFVAAERWARERGCRWLKVETQTINVPACHFYASSGCTLGAIHRFAYPDLPDETQLLWYKRLQ
jgi:GNAT superfamily N-acetyltransferase